VFNSFMDTWEYIMHSRPLIPMLKGPGPWDSQGQAEFTWDYGAGIVHLLTSQLNQGEHCLCYSSCHPMSQNLSDSDIKTPFSHRYVPP
jgi:hypothetical protein